MALRIAPTLLAFLLCASAAAWGQPRFVDVARERGLPEGFFGRNVFCDLDGDGWPDVVAGNARVLRNVPAPGGGRRFEEVPEAMGLVPEGTRAPDLLLFADLDDDGDRDAFVGYAGDPGNPKFTDHGLRSHVALLEGGRYRHLAPAAPLDQLETLVAGAWLDLDGDGRLDLVRGSHYVAGGLPLESYPLRLSRGLGGGSFEDVTARAGLSLRREPGRLDSRRPVYGLAVTDWNDDGLPDVLVCAYGRQRNLLYRNLGDGTFRDVGMATGFAGDSDVSGAYPPATKKMWLERFGHERQDEAPFRSNGNTFDAPSADFDNDGDMDVFLGEITHAWAGPSSDRSALLVNRGPPEWSFERRLDAAPRVHRVPNWNQGDLYAGWLDADNDGWLDLLLGSGEYPDDQRLRLFRQESPGRFRDVTREAGLDWDMCTQMSFADYDRDGDVDVLVGNSNNRLPAERREGRVLRLALYENRAPARHWLNVRLQGAGAAAGGSNRDGIGARVRVVAGGLTQTREISGGRGHAGHNDALEASFGLGSAARVERLEVRWPRRGSVTVLEDVAADRCLVVREGDASPEAPGPY